MPKPFHFKLEKVLEYRRQLEEQAMAELAKARQARLDQEAALAALRADLDAALKKMERDKGDAASYWLWRKYLDRLDLDIDQGRVRLTNLRDRENQARGILVQRAKERKLLEKLKTKQAKRHAEHEQLSEQKEFDEIATIRYGHENLQAV